MYSISLINVGFQFINNFCDRVFIIATYTSEVYDGHGVRELYLKNYPLSDLDNLVVKSWDTYNDQVSSTLVVNSDYLIYSDLGMIFNRWGFIRGRKNYQITYKAGYALADVPADLKQTCAQICQYIDNHKSNPGAKSEAIGKYSITYGNGSSGSAASMVIPESLLDMLQPYRRISFGEL